MPAAPTAGPAAGTAHVPAPLPALRRRVLLTGLVLLGLAALITVLVAAPATRPAVQRVDDWWYRLVADLRWAPLQSVSTALSTLFGAAVGWPVRAVVTVVLVARRHWLALAAWVATVAAGEACTGPLKALLDRPRPPGSLVGTSGASYPSGHAIAAAVTAIGIVMALSTGRRRLHWMVAAVTVAAVVSLSRTYLAAHWLSDSLGGSLIGAALALTIPEALEVARDRRHHPR
jgi:undecaprenyl-diphosphatase